MGEYQTGVYFDDDLDHDKKCLTIPSWMNMPVKARVLQTKIFVFSFPMFSNLVNHCQRHNKPRT